jgi:putative redox protein
MEKTMEVFAEYLGGAKCEVTARGHRVICDQPLDNGGSDEGMSPPEFLLVSLATCAAYYAVQYLRARNLPTQDVKVRVDAEKAKQPARLGSFRIEVMAPGLDEHHQDGVLRAVKACLIHNTLLGMPRIEVLVDTGVLAHV